MEPITDFSGRMSYADYLGLDAVLSAQHPRTSAHDEMLFIVQHQTSELWMKLAIHELSAARALIEADELAPAFKGIARVARIFEQLNGAWDVLRTMTPSDYTTFREELGASSGFQSHQYRLIEFILGNRKPSMVRTHAHLSGTATLLEAELSRPSLYDAAIACAGRHGLPAPPPRSDVTVLHEASDALVAMWEIVYRDPAAHWLTYELAEKLVDMEDYFRRWRFNHVTTVERVIGLKGGTGGTEGVSYLRRMLDVVLFPDLWRVRTVL